MSKSGWKLWIIPLAAWGLFSCWHIGYQSGYADGHDTAWKMYQPFTPSTVASAEAAIESEYGHEADVR